MIEVNGLADLRTTSPTKAGDIAALNVTTTRTLPSTEGGFCRFTGDHHAGR